MEVLRSSYTRTSWAVLEHKPGLQIPAFGFDLGGTQCKLVYLEPADLQQLSPHQLDYHRRIHSFFASDVFMGVARRHDTVHIERFHFLSFNRCDTESFFALLQEHRLLDDNLCLRIGGTGGGARSLSGSLNDRFGVEMTIINEFDALVQGLNYLLNLHPTSTILKSVSDHKQADTEVELDYPFLLVNCGTGVSILVVESPTQYKRVGGSHIGGGTFLGLCCGFTDGAGSFMEYLELAQTGDATNVDMYVSDIYNGVPLAQDLLASSFAKVQDAESNPADLCASMLSMLSYHIAHLAHLYGTLHEVKAVVISGGFASSPVCRQSLDFALRFWSEDARIPLFLRLEGFCGAIGSLTASAKEGAAVSANA